MAQINYAQEADGARVGMYGAVDSRTQAMVVVGSSVMVGLMLAMIWNFEVADTTIGATIANTTLGTDAKALVLEGASSLLGVAFAFAAGLAATFTACNCVIFSCIAPIVAQKQSQRVSLWRMIGWIVLGLVITTASYGIIGVFVGDAMPVLSTATLAIGSNGGFPVRLLQPMVVFVTLGIIFLWWGLHALGLVRNPLASFDVNRPWFKPLMLGVLIGCFTIGRPFGLFRKAFEYAIDTGNPFFSATAIALQGLGNIVVMTGILLLLMYGTGGRFERWMTKSAGRIHLVTAISLIVGGVFFIAYWGLRLPSRFGIGWFPAFS